MNVFLIRYFKIVLFIVLVIESSLSAASLIYTSGVNYQNTNYPFHDGDIVRGFVLS